MIHIIQNDPLVPPGRIQEIIDEASHDCHLWQAWDSVLPGEMPDNASSLIVLGGIMGADEDEKFPFLRTVCRWIRKAVEQDLPFLGICLGGQLLSRVCGGILTRNSCGEKGCMPVGLTEEGQRDILFRNIPSVWPSFQWHNDSFVPPSGSGVLAISRVCSFQAFRVGQNVYGVQFHPEVTPEIARDWAVAAGVNNRYLENFTACYSGYENISRQILLNFLTIAGYENRPEVPTPEGI